MSDHPWNLEEVIATQQLGLRKARSADSAGEARAVTELLRELAKSPQEFFPKLVQAVLEFSVADSAGISLLDERRKEFVWPAVAGGLESYIGAGTPSDFGPCGTVLDRNAPVLFLHPERHFTYLKPITPPLEEVLLIPFHMNGRPVGTIWAVIHENHQQFDTEDRRLLENLSNLAASAYRVLVDAGSLERFMDELPSPQPRRSITQQDGKWVFVDEMNTPAEGSDVP